MRHEGLVVQDSLPRYEINNLEDGLRHDTFEAYASIRRIVDQPLSLVGTRLQEVIDREAKELQGGFQESLSNAAGRVQQSL